MHGEVLRLSGRAPRQPEILGWAEPTGRANARPMTGSACPPRRRIVSMVGDGAHAPLAAPRFVRSFGSVPNGDAGDVGALQRPAYRFGLVALEAGEARPEQLPVAFGDDRLGERIGLGQQAAGLIARRIDALQR